MTKSLASLLLIIPGLMFAQAGSNPLTNASKNVYANTRNNVLKAAEQMPEENYSYKPVDTVRSFGELIGHVADAQYEFCGPIAQDGTKPPDVEKSKTSKADLIQALKDSYAYCDKVYAGMTDAHAADLVPFFNRKMPKLVLLDFNTAHTDEHYGNIVTYLRMKGMVPPSSQQH